MNVGSLFSGIGGIDLGLERAGMRVLWQCEADEYRRAVLRERFGAPVYEDVVRVGKSARGSAADGLRTAADNGRREAGAGLPDGINLLCGGFPCQDLSIAGKRAGLIDGERSSLFFEFARVADELVQPGGFVLIENVPGLLSSNGGRDFAVLLATLAELGFHDLAWRVLDSRYFGVPARRRRVFILGRRARGRSCAEILLEPEGGGGDSQESAEKEQGAAHVLADRSGSRISRPLGSLCDDGYRTTDLDGVPAFVSEPVRTFNVVPESGQGADLRASETQTSLALSSLNGQAHDRVTLAASEANVRRLTPTECERLQGFPDGWTELPDAVDGKRYAALGDAVTVNVAEWMGRRIMTAEEGTP